MKPKITKDVITWAREVLEIEKKGIEDSMSALDNNFIKAQIKGVSIVEYSDDGTSKHIKNIWEKIKKS